MFHKRLARMPILLVAMAFAPHGAHAEAPVTTRFEGELVSPVAAWSEFGGATTHTDGLASSSNRPPEIVALARSLSRDEALSADSFAERVALYVRNNIETEFRFGLGKGARGAIIDKSGTSFDQAELMVEILREGGQSASYRLGTITLNAQQFGKWTGLVLGLDDQNQSFTVSAKAACQLLANGGIPATVNNSSSCANLTGNLNTVTLAHVWVVTNGKSYDPSYKTNILSSGIDVADALGCGTEQSPICGAGLVAAALNGAQQGTTGNASWVRNINQDAVEAFVGAKAVSLQNEIQGSDPTAPIEAIIGGASPDLIHEYIASSNLPYPSSTQANWSGDIPDQYRVKFRIMFMGLDTTLFADEIAGDRIRLATYAGAQSFSRLSKIYLGGQAIATGTATGFSGQIDRPQISVDHPFPGGIGTGDEAAHISLGFDPRNSSGCLVYTDEGGGTYTNCDATYFAMSTLVLDVGRAGPYRESHFSKLMNARNVTESINYDMTGLTYYYNRYEGQRHSETLSARYNSQSSLGLGVIGGLSESILEDRHTIGALFHQQEAGDGQLYFNVRKSISVSSANGNAVDEDAAFFTAEAVASALEGSVLQQSQDSYESSASVSMFKLANDQGFKFYSANSSNISSVISNLSGYSSTRTQYLSQYAAAGYDLIIPEKGAVGIIDLPGSSTGQVAIGTIGEYIYKPGLAGHIINEEYKGGGASAVIDPVQTTLSKAKADAPSAKDKSYWGVDLAQGGLNLSPAPDISVGAGASQLVFQRTLAANVSAELDCPWVWNGTSSGYVANWHYNCSAVGTSSPSLVGGGWKHNLNQNASWSGSGGEGLGATSALRSSHAVAAIYSTYDAYRTAGWTSRLGAIFGVYTMIDDFVRNSVSLSDGREYVRLPSGVYDPPKTALNTELVVTGSPGIRFVLFGGGSVRRSYAGTSVTVIEADGTTSLFVPGRGFGLPGTSNSSGPYDADNLPSYVLESRTKPAGVKVNYVYGTIMRDVAEGTSKKLITAVSNSFGNALNLDYSSVFPGNEIGQYGKQHGISFISSVSDGNGRSAQFDCSLEYQLLIYQCPLSVTDVAGGVWSYELADGYGRVTKAWYTPSDNENPFFTAAYDPVLNIASILNKEGEQTKYFVTNLGSDRYRIGEKLDATGNIESFEFDEAGSEIRRTDALGRVISRVYDSANRLLREVFPEGNASEYAYDARGNVISECHIAKGRVAWSTLGSVSETDPQCDAGQGDLVTLTTFVGGPNLAQADCSNAKTCNKPAYVIDSRGFRTNYSWSSIHGQLLSEISGLDSAGNCAIGSECPEATYIYSSFSGSDGATFYLLTSKTEKLAASQQRVTAYAYDAANHYALKSATVTADGESQTTCFSFDETGNLVSLTKPLGAAGVCGQ